MIRRTIEALAAGCAVYVLMAACSSSGATNKSQPQAMAGMPSAGGQEGQGGVSVGGAGEPGAAGDLGVAGFLDPVAGASAQAGGASGVCDCPEPYVPPEPVIVEAECDTFHDPNNSHWAVIDRPALPDHAVESVSVTNVYGEPLAVTSPANFIAGYSEQAASNVIFSATTVAAQCGTTSGIDWVATSVRFVFRP